MTITIQDAKKMTREELEDIGRLEKEIDKEIAENFQRGQTSVNFCLENVKPRVRNEIMKMYRGVGWNVQYVSDQREGDYLTISEQDWSRFEEMGG